MDGVTPTPADPMRKRRTWLSRILWAAAILTLLLVLLLAVLRFTATTELGRSLVEARIEAADISGQSIEIDGMSGDLLGELTIDTLTVSDSEGVWLIATNLRAGWKPFALRRRALLIEHIDAAAIDVLRRPVIRSSPTSAGSGKLPIRAGELRRLGIEELTLREGVLPRPLVLRIETQASASHERAELSASILPIGEGDKLVADLVWTPADLLQGSVTLTSPPGGLLAELGRFAPQDGLDARLDAGGETGNWTARLEASTTSGPLMTADARQTEDVISFSGTAHLRQHPLIAAFADWAGDTADISGNAELGRASPIIDVSLAAERLGISANLSRAPDNTVVADLRAEAEQPHQLIPSVGITANRVLLDGQARYGSGQMQFTGAVTAHDLAQGDYRIGKLSGPATVSYRNDAVALTTNLTGARLQLSDLNPGLFGAAPTIDLAGVYDTRRNAVMIERARIASPGLTASAKGSAMFGAPLTANLTGRLVFDGSAAGLSRPVSANGSWTADTASGSAIAAGFDGEVSGFGDLPAPLSDWVGPRAAITARGRVYPDGSVTLGALSAKSGTARIDGEARRSATGALSASANFTVGEADIASVYSPGIDGNLRASGTLDTLVLQASITSPQLIVQSQTLTDISADIDGRYSGANISAGVTARASSEAGPISIETDAALLGGSWSLTNTDARWADLRLSGDVSGAGAELSAMRAKVDVAGIVPGDLPIERIDLSAQIMDHDLGVAGTVTGVTAGPLTDVDLVVDVSGSPQRATYRLTANGQADLFGIARALNAQMDGTATDVLDTNRAAAFTLDSQFGDLALKTLRPVRIAQTPSGLTGNASLQTLGGEIDISVSEEASARAQIDVETLDLSQLLSLMGRIPRAGTLSASAALSAVGDNLEGDLNGQVSGLRLPSGKLSDLSLGLTGRLSAEQLDLAAAPDSADGLSGQAKLNMPVTTDAARLMIRPDRQRRTEFDVDIDGPVGELVELFAPPEILMTGDIDIDISGQLPLDTDGAAGTLRFAGGSFEHDAGLVLNNIDLQADLSSQRLTLTNFTARGRDGGGLSGSGVMSLQDGGSDLEIIADNLVAVSRREGRATTSGTLNLSHTADLISLTGDLTIMDGNINLDKLPSGGPVTLGVVFEDEDEDQQAARPPLTSIDIELRAPRSIRVKGSGIDAEINLDASIEGTFSEPVIAGASRIIRGRFELLGKPFEFQDSTIRIDGDPMDAALDITAVRKSRTLTATVQITGTPRRPVVELQSTPDYPEDEILSRVLFGRSPSQLSTLETAQLAAALAQLAGGSGIDLLGGLQDALGLDTLDLGQAENGNVEVATGKYLADNIYLEVRTGVSGTPGVAIEWQPLENVEIEAETTATEGQSLTVQWTTDFD